MGERRGKPSSQLNVFLGAARGRRCPRRHLEHTSIPHLSLHPPRSHVRGLKVHFFSVHRGFAAHTWPAAVCSHHRKTRARGNCGENGARSPLPCLLLLGDNSWQELRAFSRSTRCCFFFRFWAGNASRERSQRLNFHPEAPPVGFVPAESRDPGRG